MEEGKTGTSQKYIIIRPFRFRPLKGVGQHKLLYVALLH